MYRDSTPTAIYLRLKRLTQGCTFVTKFRLVTADLLGPLRQSIDLKVIRQSYPIVSNNIIGDRPSVFVCVG